MLVRLASHRALEAALLLVAGIGAAGLLYDDALVWRKVSCETYFLPLNTLLRARVIPVVLLLALLLLVLHLVGILARRRFRRLWLDAALVGTFGLLLYITMEKTLFYCFLHGMKLPLPPCLLGCPH